MDSFVRLLEKHKVRYVLVSGYVAILFGRSRNSEDVDLFIEKLEGERWLSLWNELNSFFEQVTPAADAKEALEDYLSKGIALRFSVKDSAVPNFEFKFPKKALDFYGIANHVSCELNGRRLEVSPLESQIAYKLFLGSEKDFEDAVHLFEVCKEHLNKEILHGGSVENVD